MFIYRLQKEKDNGDLFGIGPYRKAHLITDCIEEQMILSSMLSDHNDWEHPCRREDLPTFHPYDDDIEESDLFCGCPSIESLTDWFEGYVSDLLRMGFDIVKYEVSDYIMGLSGKQVFITEDWAQGSEIIEI